MLDSTCIALAILTNFHMGTKHFHTRMDGCFARRTYGRGQAGNSGPCSCTKQSHWKIRRRNAPGLPAVASLYLPVKRLPVHTVQIPGVIVHSGVVGVGGWVPTLGGLLLLLLRGLSRELRVCRRGRSQSCLAVK
jgi:hypothetical protein